MHHEHHRWTSERLGREMGIAVYGHYGVPILVFPTSGGDEHEYASRGMLAYLGHHVDAGRVKFFCVSSVNHESWLAGAAHPRHRSYVQAQYDAYIECEVVPFIHKHCQARGISITTTGASFGAYHAANSLLKHPHLFRRCWALSGIYDIKPYMDGDYDDNAYFNNPVDYVANLTDPGYRTSLDECDIHLATGCGAWEHPEYTQQLSDVLRARGIRHSLDDWGEAGGHDWPYWMRQMDAYISHLS